jgi:spore coat polysaccharide biosynthesis protein SpsF
MDYHGKPLIDHIIDELKKTELPIVAAIPKGDYDLFDHLIGKVDIFSGSENDVIERYYECAMAHGFDPIIRVAADAKMIHHELVLQQLENYKKFGHMIYGNYCEVFSFEQLKNHHYHDKRPQTREHVTAGMIQDLTVDYKIDLD